MGVLRTVELLCDIVDRQNRIIQQQADALAQLGAVCAEEEREQVKRMKSQLAGEGW